MSHPFKKQPRYVAPGEKLSRWRPFMVVTDTHGRRVIIYWPRCLSYLGLATITVWFAAAGVLWGWLASRHLFPELSYVNLVLPWRWEQHRLALGQHHFFQAEQTLAENQLGTALMHLRIGLQHAPADTTAREQLADLYLRIQQPQQASDLLIERFAQELGNLPYVKRTVDALRASSQDTKILQLAEQHLPALLISNPVQPYLALQCANVHYRLGHYRQAITVLRRWLLDQSAEGIVLLAQCELADGYPQLAIDHLVAGRENHPASQDITLTLLRAYHETNQTDAARRLTLERYAADPFSPGPRIDVLEMPAVRDHPAILTRETTRYLQEFSHDPRALALMAQFAINIRQPTLATQTRITAEAVGHPVHLYRLAEIECHIRNGSHAESEAAIQQAMQDPPPRMNTLLTGLQAVVAGSQNDPASSLYQESFITARPSGDESFRVAKLFYETGQPHRARDILSAAADQHPSHQKILSRLVELDIETHNLADLDRQLTRLLELPSTPRPALLAVAKKLALTETLPPDLQEKIQLTQQRLAQIP